MSLSIPQYAYILLFLLILVYLFRWILELRFHLQFGRVGFFSITDIRYYHGGRSNNEHTKWSVTVGKIKTRLKRPSSLSSTAWVTIHLANVHIAVSDLASLRRGKGHKCRPTSVLNHRLSTMSNSLKRIPWWYSLSIVKYILKFTSALPAQFLMAGLANYVDVQLDGLTLSIGDAGTLRVEDINFSSVLFAAVARPQSPPPPPIIEQPMTSDSASGTEHEPFSFHSRHQRHSLKRAEHLFKEKYFEISVQVGQVSLLSAQHKEMVALPLGSRLAISCHLSAGFLTLKDVNLNVQIDALQVRLDQLLRLRTDSTSGSQLDDSLPAMNKRTPNANKKANHIRLIRTVNLSVSDTALTLETATGIYTSFRLHSTAINLVADKVGRSRLQTQTYSLQGGVEQTYWSVFNSKPEAATDCLEILRMPRIRLGGSFSDAILLGSRTQLLEENPNGRFFKVSVALHKPKIVIDMEKRYLLDGLSDWSRRPPQHRQDPSDQFSEIRAIKALPKITMVLSIEALSIKYYDAFIDMPGERAFTTFKWSSITLEISGEYANQLIRKGSAPTTPLTSPLLSPSSLDGSGDLPHVGNDEGLRKRHSMKAWTKLFRRSWRGNGSGFSASDEAAITRWTYSVSGRFFMDNISGRYKTGEKLADETLASMDGFEVIAGTHLDSDSVSGKAVGPLVWKWETHYNELDMRISGPTVIIDDKLISAMQRWTGSGSKNNNDNSTSISARTFLEKAKYLKTNFTITALRITLDGLDQGLKGSREVPDGYMDNAPRSDVGACMVINVEETSFGFSGAHAVAPRHNFRHVPVDESLREKETMDTNEDEPGRTSDSKGSNFTRIGRLHAIMRYLTVRNSFSSESAKVDDDLMLWSSRMNMSTDVCFKDNILNISPAIVAKKFGVRYALNHHYACLLIINKLQRLRQTHVSRQDSDQSKYIKQERMIQMIQMQLQINRFDVSITLPNNTKLYLRLDGIRMQSEMKDSLERRFCPIIVRNMTLFVISPKQSTKWEQLVELDSVNLTLPGDLYELEMSKMLLRIPHGYLVANIVDNGVTYIKCVKALHSRLLAGKPFTIFSATANNDPQQLPRMRLKTDTFRIHIDDDPFEVRLRLIWKAGYAEQASRIALREAFEAKAQSVIQASPAKESSRKALDNEQSRTRFLSSTGSTKKQDSSASQKHVSSKDCSSLADMRVNDAWQGLLEHNSSSWIKNIKNAIQKETSIYERMRKDDYQHVCTTGQLNELYDEQGNDSLDVSRQFVIETLPIPPHPALFDFTMKSMFIEFLPPTFALDHTRQFVHDIGKGIPLDTNFSTLIPFHLEWQAGETWAQIRDYPIPILLVPPAADGGMAWSLSGDYVFGDELGGIEATRCLNIPIVNTIYDLDITRTSSPPKFYSVVNIRVHTQDMSSISWSVPFQPAIQDVSRTFESLTRPPVDPSPKVGFWDKIRLMIHTRTRISFVGGGDFAFVMKGTRDPYETGERGTGLAKVWRKDVVWLLGHDNPEREFMQIISREYAFGVPDLVNGGYIAPYILPRSDTRQGSLSDFTSISQRETMAPKRTCSNGSTISSDKSDPRFLKVALKLSEGIRMGIGCQLERTCSPGCAKCGVDEKGDWVSNCRFLHFRPHYSVRYRTPQSVQAMGDKAKDYDAFAGFRSNFIHLSISIVKLTTDNPQKVDITNAAMNSMHLTPGFIDHFVAWFRLFGGAMSYPLRNGPLFPRNDPRPTKKFGKHMSTMKYKVMVQPLTIAYFYRGDNMPDECPQNTSDHVGLKAVVAAFNVDIHQRREISNVADQKLNSKRLKANWPMHEAEVHLKSIDMRAIHAQFSTDSASTPEIPAVSLTGSSESSDSSGADPDLMEGTDRDRREEAELSDWVDIDDFVELHTAKPSGTPTAQVLPFAYSPCIYYLKQNNRADIEKYRYLRDTHCCIMGTAVDTREMQLSFLKERSENIDIQIRKHQARLHTVQTKLAAQYDDALDAESEAIVSKTTTLFEKRNLLQQYLRELSSQSDPMNNPAYSSSTIFGRDSLVAWENLMGHFKQRYIVHNPQIIWNNAVRNVIYHFLDLQAHRRALSYYTSMRAAKFLRDLTQKYEQERSWKPDTTVLDDSDSGFDSAMAEELIQKLLSEQDSKFVAPNETEEAAVAEDAHPKVEIADNNAGGNVNDPHKQKSSIPEGYAMKSSYLIDLLNTQISFQSDRDPDSLVIMSNERMQVKGLNITDTNDPDAEMELVKNRTIVSIENSQVFVAKKEQFDSVDLLLDNHYGGKQTDRWLAWIPLEMLIDNVKGTENFQRVAYRVASTVQYDKYNQLRFKTHPSAFAHIHPFEDRCDSVHLNFPELALTVNSSQYNAVYEVVTDLLLYKEPAKKERLARLREIMMSADRNNIYHATDRIIALQEKVRQLSNAYRQYAQNYAILDERRLIEFKALRATLRECHEELYLGMEAIKLIQSNQRKDSAEAKTNLKFTFSGERLLWEMLTDDGVPLCECNLKNTTYILISKEDRSSSNTLEIDELYIKNTSPSPVFVDILGPYLSAGRKTPDFSRRKMLRGYLVALAPVGGIPVVQHLELNLFPLRLQMTYEFGKALASYFFPAERRRKPAGDSPQPSPTSTVDPSPTGSGKSVIGVSASTPEASQRPSSGHTTLNSDNRSEGHPAMEDTLDADLTTENRKSDSIFCIPRDKSEQDIAGEALQIPSSTTSTGKRTLKRSKKKRSKQEPSTDDLSVMKKRASSNRAFILVKIPGTKHCLSYQGPKEKNIEDLRDFVFQQPNLEYRNKTWSWYELSSTIKRDFLKAALLHNSTALLKEKLTIRRHHPKEAGSKFSEFSFSMHSNNLTVPDDSLRSDQQSRIYDYMDNMSDSTDSSDDVFDEGELESDAVSMHSISLYDNDHIVSTEEHHSSRRFLPWQRKSKKQKPVDVDETSTTRSKRLSIDSVDTSIRGPWVLDQELTAKGRMLLGKRYHGPILHQPLSSPKAKDDKRSIHSKANGIKSLGS